MKFTPEGGQITLKAVVADGSVEISVSDPGIGIAPEDQEAIFEEFRQVGGDDARKREGTGLGLTLVPISSSFRLIPAHSSARSMGAA